MRRASCLLSVVAIVAWAIPGCSGTEFTGADESAAGEAGETATGGKGGSSGQGGTSSGTAGTDSGGSDVGGNGNGGSGRGGDGGTGTDTGGAHTGGDAGDGASGGSDAGGMSGTSGAAMGGAGAGSGGGSGRAGAGSGGIGGAGFGGKGGAGSGGNGGAGGAGSGGKGGAGSGGKGGTGGAGSGGKGGSGGAGPRMCPPDAPSAGAACSFMGHCSYGTHPLQRCRDVYACDGVRWQLTQDASCATPPSCQSLPTPPIINAQCTPEGAECQGANNLYCLCAPDCSTVCTVPPIWQCFGVPGDCPSVLPNQGQPCNVNLSCVYGSCASQTGVQAICENGAWTWLGLFCPQ
jgi:hypothetical protein